MFARLFKRHKDNTPIKRNSIDKVNFNKKSAVVLVGVSGIGKTTFAKNFIAKHPAFKHISYDMCYREIVKQSFLTSKSDAKYMAEELFNDKLLEHQYENIIIDKIVLNPQIRAQLLQQLHDLNYTVHVVYFTQEYTEKHIRERQILRSIEMVIMSKSPDASKLVMDLDLNPIELYASKQHKTMDEIIDEFKYTPAVQEELKYHVSAYEKELKLHDITNQEESGAFMEGADYYYEIT